MSRDRAVVTVETAAREAVGRCPRCRTVPRVTARSVPAPQAKGTPWIAVRGVCDCPPDERSKPWTTAS